MKTTAFYMKCNLIGLMTLTVMVMALGCTQGGGGAGSNQDSAGLVGTQSTDNIDLRINKPLFNNKVSNNVRLHIADTDPHPDLASVIVNIDRMVIRMHKGKRWADVNLASNLGQVDLLKMKSGATIHLDDVQIPSGVRVDEIRFILKDSGNFLVRNDGSQCEMNVPSGERSGIKVKIPKNVVIETGYSYAIVADIASKKSFFIKDAHNHHGHELLAMLAEKAGGQSNQRNNDGKKEEDRNADKNQGQTVAKNDEKHNDKDSDDKSSSPLASSSNHEENNRCDGNSESSKSDDNHGDKDNDKKEAKHEDNDDKVAECSMRPVIRIKSAMRIVVPPPSSDNGSGSGSGGNTDSPSDIENFPVVTDDTSTGSTGGTTSGGTTSGGTTTTTDPGTVPTVDPSQLTDYYLYCLANPADC